MCTVRTGTDDGINGHTTFVPKGWASSQYRTFVFEGPGTQPDSTETEDMTAATKTASANTLFSGAPIVMEADDLNLDDEDEDEETVHET